MNIDFVVSEINRLAVDCANKEREIAELYRMIDLAWNAIQEAGYEDHCNELRDFMEKL